MSPKPTAILLATDLTARSDRAQARAIQLAKQWQAKLVVAVAMAESLTFSRPNGYQDADTPEEQLESPSAYIERIAKRELADADVPVEIHVVTGAPGAVAISVAQQTGCGLIVTGTSRSEAVMRIALGSTLRWLSRHSPMPVLAVHDRPRSSYQHLCVASDFSAVAAQALKLTDTWFADATDCTVLHGYSVPLSTLSLNDAPRAAALEVLHNENLQQAHDHIVQTLGEAAAKRWAHSVQASGPVRLLREHARTVPTDLTVIASHGRSALMDKLMGSVAERLLETVGSDLLIVRSQRG